MYPTETDSGLMSGEITAMKLLGGGVVAHPVGPATETAPGAGPVVRIDRWGPITNPDPMGSASRWLECAATRN